MEEIIKVVYEEVKKDVYYHLTNTELEPGIIILN